MQYQHLANFKSKEGYWHDRNIFESNQRHTKYN